MIFGLIDLIIVALPLVFVFLPVIKGEFVTLKLFDIMPRNLYTLIYAIPAGGLIVRYLFYRIRKSGTIRLRQSTTRKQTTMDNFQKTGHA